MSALAYSSVASMQPYDASELAGIVNNRNSRFFLDLSGYSLVGVLQAYQTYKRTLSPKYTNSPVVYQLHQLQKTIGGNSIMPLDVIDKFWVCFEKFLVRAGIRPSTIKHYFDTIRAALSWASKHNCAIPDSYADYVIGSYSRTKVALTADEVSFIAHFDIAAALSCKNEEFADRAKKMLVKDIDREERKRAKQYARLVAHAQKNYNTAVAAADRLYAERLSRTKITEYKKRKARSLYSSEINRAKDVLKIHVIEAKNLIQPLSEAEKKALLQQRIEKIKHQAEYSRQVKIQTYERVRDQFILQCSFGQRYSDICRISPSCFSEDLNTFSIVQKKTGNKAVVNLAKFAFDKHVVRQILVKYGCHAPYPHSISNYNRILKDLIKMIGFNEIVKSENKIHGEMVIEEMPKNKAITSHTARRSFATYNFNFREFSEIAIRRATGHTDGRSFQRYVIFDEDQ